MRRLFCIGFCEDQPEDAAEVRRLTELFSQEHPECPIKMEEFSSPFDLLDRIEGRGGFDLYLLDVVMPHMTGVELARRIRERGEPAEILFLTVSREYAVEAFGVKASGYLLKPVEKTEYDRAVLSCMEKLSSGDKPVLVLKVREGLRRILLSELVSVESFNHTRVLTMADGRTYETTATLAGLYERLREHPRFYMPHRAYIVNLDYVTGLSGYELLLPGDRHLPVPRSSYQRFKTTYLDYITK